MMKHIFAFLLLACAPLWAGAAEAPLLINGTIVAPDRVIANGWLAIQDGKILSVTADKPKIKGARTLVTKDIVFPGFVDLHNHPLYGIFPRWKPTRAYASRYEWRADPAYLQSIQVPEGKIVTTHFCDMDTYVELQALIGGTTSILGIYEPADTPKVPPCVEGLARNLDWATGFHGKGVGHERIGNILGVRPNDLKLSQGTLAMIKSGDYDLATVHLGEGRRDDADSQAEFARLKELSLLTPKTVVIHGVALSEQDFAEMSRAGTAFIWSPRSNFELYGQTADVAAAKRQNVIMALAPDWSPTGSMNMLAEIRYASTVNDRDFAGLFTPKQLFEMATVIPARIARIDGRVGSLAPRLHADLFLLRGDATDVYTALTRAAPEDVTLTLVNGVPLYGTVEHFNALGIATVEGLGVCREKKVLNTQALPEGGLLGVMRRLTQALAPENLRLASLAECS